MDKEKEIEEICEIFETDVGVYRDDCLLSCKYAARLLVENGYRKADEVRKETIKKCSEWLRENATIIDEENFAREFDFAFGIKDF